MGGTAFVSLFPVPQKLSSPVEEGPNLALKRCVYKGDTRRQRAWDLCFVISGRSFIIAKKRSGPRTVPCGTPERTSALVDLVPSKRTDCFLWLRNNSIQRSVELRTQ